MSPAGYWPQLRAAVEAGADSVYFGLKHFTARAKVGFSLAELPEVVKTLHSRGVKGFVTFNTLVFEHELDEAARTIAAIAEAGADALIVQDAGVVALARRIVPELELHGSTQMSITDANGVRLASQLGVRRVTLARELSLAEVKAIRSQTDCDLEIFVHGALCVAYSGQCFSSEAWGGRSANRGQCAQACRLPYELVVDGETKALGDSRYLLSPGDLYTLREIPQIVDIGVSALKIEGRYKDADYVAITTRAYRQAVDEAVAGVSQSLTAAGELQIEQVYSRGLGPYFASGTNHQAVVQGRAPRHRGVLMGRVSRVTANAVFVEPSPSNDIAPLKPGDGLVFDAAAWRSPELPEEGGRVYEVRLVSDGLLDVRFGNGAIRGERIRPGDLVWRTHDPELDKAVRPLLDAVAPIRRQPVSVFVKAHEGMPLEMRWTLKEHPEVGVTVVGESPLERAGNHGLDEPALRAQLSRLGNTAYALASLESDLRGAPFAPASLLNQLRRQAVDKLAALQSAASQVELHDPQQVLDAARTAARLEQRRGDLQQPRLHLLVRTPEQLDAAITLEPASITLDYLDLYGLRPSVERVKAAGITARVASPRILKPGEERIIGFLIRLECPILVRSTGLIEALKASGVHRQLIGDFSLNAANSLTAAEYLNMGLAAITPTYDLNAAQIAALAATIGGERVEAVVYSHLPVFHTEHCVFCRFMSTGTSFKDCGRPCEEHRVAVRDVGGRAHPVVADVGCRNTVFGAEAQEASGHLDTWRNAGIADFRVEFVHESPKQVARITDALKRALNGRIPSQALAKELKDVAPQGVTQGSLFVSRDYLSLPILQ
jgi:putative protease